MITLRHVGKQKCEDTGAHESVWKRSTKNILEPNRFHRSRNRDQSRSLYGSSGRMHIWTRLKPESQGNRSGVYPDGVVEHDGQVGQLLESSTTRDRQHTI